MCPHRINCPKNTEKRKKSFKKKYKYGGGTMCPHRSNCPKNTEKRKKISDDIFRDFRFPTILFAIFVLLVISIADCCRGFRFSDKIFVITVLPTIFFVISVLPTIFFAISARQIISPALWSVPNQRESPQILNVFLSWLCPLYQKSSSHCTHYVLFERGIWYIYSLFSVD